MLLPFVLGAPALKSVPFPNLVYVFGIFILWGAESQGLDMGRGTWRIVPDRSLRTRQAVDPGGPCTAAERQEAEHA